uniref:C2H2-type domain-containing protein n=1 Tax=Biomphalaria glabrata TaxID=6526 RepID=A0A2C9LK84_BIOGL
MARQSNPVDYQLSLAKYIKDSFTKMIVPQNFLLCIHKYNLNVLTDLDMKRVRQRLTQEIPEDVNVYLLDLLPKYEGWFECVINVLSDPEVKQPHIAQHFQDLRSKHDEKWKAEHLQDCEQNVRAVTEVIPQKLADGDVAETKDTLDTSTIDDGLTLGPALNDSSDSDVNDSLLNSESCADDSHMSSVSHSLLDSGINDSLVTDSIENTSLGVNSIVNDSADIETENLLSKLSIIENKVEWSATEGKGKCLLCNIDLTSEQHMHQHVTGRNHSKKLQRSSLDESPHIKISPTEGEDVKYCYVCGLSLTSPENARQHYDGRNHKKKVEANKPMSTAAVPKYSSDPINSVDQRDPNHCNICMVTHTSPETAKQHYEGKSHKKKFLTLNIDLPNVELNDSALTEAVDNDIYSLDTSGRGQCKICNVSFTSKQLAKEHLDGFNHKKKLATLSASKINN